MLAYLLYYTRSECYDTYKNIKYKKEPKYLQQQQQQQKKALLNALTLVLGPFFIF